MTPQKNTKSAPLTFPEWVEQTYPEKTAKREFLRMIGALDLAYLMYRMQSQPHGSDRAEPTTKIPSMPLKVEEHKKPRTKQSTKSKKPTIAKEEKKDDLTMEFDHEPTPSVVHAPKPHPGVHPELVERVGANKKAKKKPATPKAPKKVKELTMSFHKETEPVIVHPKKIPAPVVHEEPEPLVLEAEPMIEHAPVKKPKKIGWLDDDSLEETDLRKLKQPLTTDGITVSFNVRDNQGEDETVITVNDTAWRASLTSPSLDLSAMAQIVRVSYGELYVLGRMALGAMSGEGYIESAEVVRIVKLLAEATGSTITCDIAYFDKDALSKTRTGNSMHVRFERA